MKFVAVFALLLVSVLISQFASRKWLWLAIIFGLSAGLLFGYITQANLAEEIFLGILVAGVSVASRSITHSYEKK